MAHILGESLVVSQPREVFLSNVDSDWSIKLRLALHGDWPAAVLNPHVDLSRLVEAVRYVGRVVQALRANQTTAAKEKQSKCVQ